MNPTYDFTAQVAFVTGASSGMGLAAARAAYHATKHGVIGLTKSAALEYGPRGVRVNAVCPSTISTPMVDAMVAAGQLDRGRAETGQAIDRLGTAEEIAQAVLWLCSPGAGYVTGVALPVDGGYTAQ
ncbi:SDR family NAD(P)-dependent oxidoreductase [Actinomadura verrucosospora]